MQKLPDSATAASDNFLNLLKLNPIGALVIAATLFFLGCSSLRHALFQSTGFDLGIYDQVVYLISQGQPPISSFLGFHHLGNHAAVSIYPLAWLYKIVPSVYWLFLVQSLALALAALPAWRLALLAGLKANQALAIAAIYLLYPVVFNVNLFDFHPEVMALPVIFGVMVAAKLNYRVWFSLGILWILGCKAVLSLTVIALGIWLVIFERRRWCGSIALFLGVSWFIIATQIIIPLLSGTEAAGVWRYTYLGNSVVEIVTNLIFKPQLVLGKFLSFETLKYLLLLMLPILWVFLPTEKKSERERPKLYHFVPLIVALPTFIVNSLSDIAFQRSLAYQYSLPIIPFLLLVAITRLADIEQKSSAAPTEDLPRQKSSGAAKLTTGFYPTPKTIVIWSLLMFLFLGKVGKFWIYFQTLDTWQATQAALSQIQPQGGVLTDNFLAPHLSHRPVIKLLSQIDTNANLSEFQYILLNQRHPWPDTRHRGEELVHQLQTSSQFKLISQQNEVVLFAKNN